MIEVEHLSKTYGSTTALQEVTFQAKSGEVLGLLGPNGAGKTTTMRILAGYLPATQGTARIAGYEVHEQPMEVRQRIGYLPETPPLYPDMTVIGYLHFVARLKGLAAGDRPQRVQWAIQKCNLTEVEQTLIHKLSKGFRQRVGIAQAIVHDPPAIILDEPTVGLDPRQIIDVRRLIKDLAQEKTVILSTHILPEVNMTCDRVAIISRGKVVDTNTLKDLTAQQTDQVSFELEVQGDAQVIVQCLDQLPETYSWRWLSGSMQERRRLRVTCPFRLGLGHHLASRLVHEGIELHEMRRLRASLEDIYLELTTQEEQTALELALTPDQPEGDGRVDKSDQPVVDHPTTASHGAETSSAKLPEEGPEEGTES